MLCHFCFDYEPDTEHHLDEDEQLARALQESMNDGPPLQNIHSDNSSLISIQICNLKFRFISNYQLKKACTCLNRIYKLRG